MAETINHYQVGQKYRMVIERAAVKGIDGFKVEANGDELSLVETDIKTLYADAHKLTEVQE